MASRNQTTKVGRRLKAARVKSGMTQDDAAVALRGILPPSRRPSGSQISRIESGAIREPQVYVVAALARVYQRPLEEIAPELLGEAVAVRALLTDVIDLSDEGGRLSTCSVFYESFEPRLFDPDELDEVIDLRDHIVARVDENESLALLANAS